MRTALALTTLLVAGFLTGCGSDDSTGNAPSGSGGPSASGGDETASELALTTGGFCDKLDPAALTEQLGATKPLELRIEQVKGKKYAQYTGGKKVTALGSMCFYSDNDVSDEGTVFTIQLGNGEAGEVQESLDKYETYADVPDYPRECTVEDGLTYGDPAGVAVCVPKEGEKASTTVTALGLVGDVRYSCTGAVQEPTSTDEVESTVRDLCESSLEAIAG